MIYYNNQLHFIMYYFRLIALFQKTSKELKEHPRTQTLLGRNSNPTKVAWLQKPTLFFLLILHIPVTLTWFTHLFTIKEISTLLGSENDFLNLCFI